MNRFGVPVGDSQSSGSALRGGAVPGLVGACAFHGRGAERASIPIVLSAPHGGRAYPDSLLATLRAPEQVLLRLEDRLVDCLAEAVAQETGAPFVVADAPRAMIDLNRALDDVDWDMIAHVPPADPASAIALRKPPQGSHPAHRARSGLGLVPRRLPGVGELWKGRINHDDLAARIALIHRPYHLALESLVDRVRQQWGAVLLIDLHSMPPLPGNGGPAAQFVIGDRFGTACGGELVAGMFAHLAAARRLVAHNRPYAGGFVLDRHARRGNGIHAVQIEIDRTAYLDAAMARIGPGFDAMVALLTGMVRQLADDVVALGRDRLRWGMAAE